MSASESDPVRLAQAALAAFARRDFAAAEQHARALVAQRPNDPNANQVLGAIALERGDPGEARHCLERADSAAPNQSRIVNSLGVALRRLGETAAARRAFARAGELGLPDAWRNLGLLEEAAKNDAASIAAYRRALALAPRDAAAHGALAHALERRHDLESAERHAEAALAGDPHNALARIALARLLLRRKAFAAAEAAAAPLIDAPGATPTNQALAWGLLGEARDGQGETAGAFTAFTAANAILREQHAVLLTASDHVYHPDGVRRMAALAEPANPAAHPAKSRDPAPAFLIGFPRSGTTLLDQILASHSAIFCIEEAPHFTAALEHVLADGLKRVQFSDLTDAVVAAVRAEYWRRVRADHAPPPDALIIDKLPLNIVVLPLIERVFPDAKIIFALRDPRDVVLSCYQQRFGMNAAMAQFLDLSAAAAYYDAVMTLFERCRDRLALDLHEVRYENVVADLESAARAIAAFLGVPFDPAMLAFQETARTRAIDTPSARQVIEPLYNSAIGRWRRYREHLAPVLPTLDRWAARYGYEP